MKNKRKRDRYRSGLVAKLPSGRVIPRPGLGRDVERLEERWLLAGDIAITSTTPVVTVERNNPGLMSIVGFTFSQQATTDDFQASIDWGDGQSGPARVSPGGSPGGFVVQASHVYGDEGNFGVHVRLTGPGGSEADADVAARVLEAPDFSPSATYSTPGRTIGLADFTGDGIPDMVAAYTTLSVLPGNGDGTFKAGIATTLPGSTHTEAQYLSTADFNGDGRMDLVVSMLGGSRDPDHMVILLGKGDGTFQLKSDLTGIGGDQVIAADLDGDGRTDLASILIPRAGGPGAITIQLGNGDGTFSSTTLFGPADLPTFNSIVVEDLNGDGKLDVAGTDFVRSRVEIWSGNGDGTFGTGTLRPIPVQSQTWPTVMTSGDLNHDGRPDLLFLQSISNELSVMLNTGGGTFQTLPTAKLDATRPSDQTEWVYLAATADVNGDGIVDLVRGDAALINVNVKLGLGDGTFAPDVHFKTVGPPNAGNAVTFAVGDLNGDGLPDLVSGFTGVLLSTKLLVSPSSPKLTESPSAQVVDLGTFRHDDVTAAAGAYSGTVDWGNGQSSDLVIAPDGQGGFRMSASAVFNKQGTYVGRLTLRGPGGVAPAINAVSVVVSDAPLNVIGTFEVQGTEDVGIATVTLARFSDADARAVFGPYDVSIDWGDGVTSTGSTVAVANLPGTFDVRGGHVYSRGGRFPITVTVTDREGGATATITSTARIVESLTLQNPVPRTVQPADVLALGEFTGDGRLDAVVAGSQGGGLKLLPGRADGTFGAAMTIVGQGAVGSVATGDFNGDGRLDLATLRSDAPDAAKRLDVFFGLGGGLFSTTATVDLPDAPAGRIVGADVDGDGLVDLVVPARGAAVYIALSRAGGAFDVRTIPSTSTVEDVAVGDVNGDGRTDVVVFHAADATVDVLQQAADGSFGPANTFDAIAGMSSNPTRLSVADLNEDGRADVVLADGQRNRLAVLLAGPDGVMNPPVMDRLDPAVAADTQVYGSVDLVVADLNGDGFGDLLLGVPNAVVTRAGGGTGTFLSPQRFPLGGGVTQSSTSVAAGDLNGDGFVDVAASIGSTNSLYTLHNNSYAITGVAVSAKEGISTGNVSVATIAQDDVALTRSVGFSATIDWGDGTTGPGSVVVGAGGLLNVLGSHLYAEVGDYTGRVSVTLPGGLTLACPLVAHVLNAPFTLSAVPSSVVVNVPVTLPLVRITDTNGLSLPSDFTAKINWGSGAVTDGFLRADGPGSYTVFGTHTFTLVGTQTVSVVVSDVGGGSSSAAPVITVKAVQSGTVNVSGAVFEDRDFDGARGGAESGLPLRTVYVDLNGNGRLDVAEPQALTGQDGSYVIAGVSAGTWVVRQVMEVGWLQTMPAGGAGRTVNVTNGQAVTQCDFGNVYLPSAVVIAGPALRNSALDSARIMFDEPVSGLTLSDLSLQRNGGANLLGAGQTLTSDDAGITWTLSGLAAVTADDGTYLLSILPGGAVDVAGRGLAAAAAASWQMDTTPPEVVSASFDSSTLPHRLRVRFSEDVSSSLRAGDLSLDAGEGGASAAELPSSMTYDAATQTATFLFDGALPEGSHRATLWSQSLVDSAGNHFAAPFVFTFGYLPGDANQDGKVDFLDLVALAQNYNGVGGGADKGDFNYDQKVDFNDLTILAQHYNTSLPSPVSPASSSPVSGLKDLLTDSEPSPAGASSPRAGVFSVTPIARPKPKATVSRTRR